jgi:hypothetical protein
LVWGVGQEKRSGKIPGPFQVTAEYTSRWSDKNYPRPTDEYRCQLEEMQDWIKIVQGRIVYAKAPKQAAGPKAEREEDRLAETLSQMVTTRESLQTGADESSE